MTEGGAGSPPVVRVRKYGNRRMYDLERSRYVALDELAALVREGRTVQVEDVKSGEDVTHATLVQALVEAREVGRFLSEAAVVGLLRLGDQELREVLGGALENVLGNSNGNAMELRAERAVEPAPRVPERVPPAVPAEVREVREVRAERPAPMWPAPSPIGGAPPAGVYAAQPASAGIAEEVTSLRREIDGLRSLLERVVRAGK